jgi:putative transposase
LQLPKGQGQALPLQEGAMKFDPAIHHRRSIRLSEYDYASSGAYFVTICTQNRVCVLEDSVIAGIVVDVWRVLFYWFPTIELDDFVLMPNHIHFIVWLQSNVGATLAAAQPNVGATLAVAQRAGANPAPTDWIIPRPEKVNLHPTLGDVVGAFKPFANTSATIHVVGQKIAIISTMTGDYRHRPESKSIWKIFNG